MPTKRATSAVLRKLLADAPGTFEPLGYRFGQDREEFERAARAHLGDKSELRSATLDGADWDELFKEFKDEPATPAAEPSAFGHDPLTYHGYRIMGAPKGSVWHLSPHNDEFLCRPVTGAVYLELEEANRRSRGICAGCSRLLGQRGPYVRPASPAPAAPAPAKGRREALGAASVDGWELLYDKPKQGAEVGRRYADGKAEYALICKAHGHVHPLPRLTAERSVRANGGWCPSC